MSSKAIACVVLTACAAGTFSSEAGERADTAANALDEVVVTGTNAAVRRDLLPYTVSVVDSRQLESTGSTQVLSAISGMVPGLFVTERSVFGFGVSNGGAGHIKLRGVGGDRASGVLMLVDGQPQFAGIYSHHVADFYDKEYVERVEVLRGPGSVLYGSNAMAGAINVITRRPKADGVHTTVSSQYGSYNTWLSSATNTVRYGRFSSLASISYGRTDGHIDNLDFNQTDGYLKAGYDISPRWTATADLNLMHFNGSDPVYPRLSDPESTDIYRQSISRGETSLCLTDRYDSTSGSLRAYFSWGNHFVDDPRHFHSRDGRVGVTAYQSMVPWRGAQATAGFDFDHYYGEIPVSGGTAHKPGSLSTMERKSVTEYSPYVTLSQSLAGDLVSLSAGLRMANSDMFDTRWVPQGGVALNPGRGWHLKANAAAGYRNPSFRELYLYRMANPDLQPEQMVNYEVSAGRSWARRLTADVTLYYSRGSDMIQTIDSRNVNTGRFINKGVEVSVHSYPLDNLRLYATYSYLHTSLRELTGAPRHQYFIGAGWQPVRRLSLDAEVKGVGRLYVADDYDYQSYALLNLKATVEVCRYVSLFARLDNITDARYTINRGYPMPGFTALGGFNLEF